MKKQSWFWTWSSNQAFLEELQKDFVNEKKTMAVTLLRTCLCTCVSYV